MAKRKLQLTAFARFFIVMIIAAPLAYMGASYYNNQDGLQNLKDLFNGKLPNGQTTETVTETRPSEPVAEAPRNEVPTPPKTTTSSSEPPQAMKALKEELAYKNRRIEELSEQLDQLKDQLKAKDQEMSEQAQKMEKIQKQLKLIQKAAGGE